MIYVLKLAQSAIRSSQEDRSSLIPADVLTDSIGVTALIRNNFNYALTAAHGYNVPPFSTRKEKL